MMKGLLGALRSNDNNSTGLPCTFWWVTCTEGFWYRSFLCYERVFQYYHI